MSRKQLGQYHIFACWKLSWLDKSKIDAGVLGFFENLVLLACAWRKWYTARHVSWYREHASTGVSLLRLPHKQGTLIIWTAQPWSDPDGLTNWGDLAVFFFWPRTFLCITLCMSVGMDSQSIFPQITTLIRVKRPKIWCWHKTRGYGFLFPNW
jgi:hypothetical protein